MGAFGLYTHIQANNVRSAILLAGFPVLLLGIVYALTLGLIGAGYLPSTGTLDGDLARAGGYMLAGAPLALLVSGVWFLVAWFGNTAIIDLATGARPVTRAQEPELYNLLENLCISRGIPTPSLRIIESEALNAFASGVTRKQYSITVTRGLMSVMDRDELEAVLGHELTHIQNRDVRTMVIASVFAGVITLIAQIVFRGVRFGGAGRSRGNGKGGAGIFVLAALAVAAVGYVLAIVIRMALSRSREFVADAGAVELTKNPDAMIGALRKIEASTLTLEAPEAVQAMFLENEPSGALDIFATHPPISKRIAALVKYAGGRDTPQVDPIATPAPAGAPTGPWG
ncbi:MAG: M48 family metallopeptidase [Caulobacter sp.]|nr:M48 family metallopeptidase [Caulobacter sp.]